MDMNQYMDMFVEESREHLQALNENLLELEKDNKNIAVLNEIFRSAHTIKGMSATMGFNVIVELTHEMENVLDLLRKQELDCTPDIIDVLFKCVDKLEFLVENASADIGAGHIENLLIELKSIKNDTDLIVKNKENISTTSDSQKGATGETSCLEITTDEENAINSAKQNNLNILIIKIILEDSCVLKAVRAYMVLDNLSKIGEVLKTIPNHEQLEQEAFKNSFEVLLATSKDNDEIEKVLLKILEVASVEINQFNIKTAVVSEPTQVTEVVESKNIKENKTKAIQTVRVDSDKLDVLLNIVGELVINKTRLEQIGLTNKISDLTETVEQIELVTSELQAIVMKIRMVPINQVFNRFPRMVRDLARELGKEVELIIEGEETELDRTVIDEVGDPIVHLLRNSVDHGIESAQERIEMGKNPIGTIRLVASHEGNNVVISIEDDGKGIDLEVIKRKATEKGLISQAEVETMDYSEAMKILFMPGFSTATTVSDVSGRGVGMDVVKTNIESLSGTVDVETKLGIGSKFKIRLPLTLAIIQALLVQVSDETYAIPLNSIDSTISILPEDITTVQNREVFLLRGEIIPILKLEEILDIERNNNIIDNYDEFDNDIYVVVVQLGEQKAGIIVDTLIGQHDIVIKPLGKLMSHIHVIAGATVLGDGGVALILDISTLIQSEYK